MPVAQALAEFKAAVAQCDSLIANAHQANATGAALLPALDREQITVAAFLNMFIGWETFLEVSLAHLMAGAPTISGVAPKKYVSPITPNDACAMIIGAMRFFDYANHDHVRKMVNLYFHNGYPYEPHLSGIMSDLADLKTMRNASAHVSSTTQMKLEGLALRIFGQPKPGITLYQILTAVDPRSSLVDTVFLTYKNKLILTAELISTG
jgi:hypothetical protein